LTPISHRIEYLFFSLFRGFLMLLPFPAVQRLGRRLGRASYHLMGRRRRITLDNLRHAFPEKSPDELATIAGGAFENFGIAICEFLCFPKLGGDGLRRLLNFDDNRDHFGAIASAGGLVFLTGHFGNWELAGAGSAALAGVPYLVVVRTQANRLVDRVVNDLRCGFGNRVVPMERAIRESLTVLKEGGVVGLAPDQSATRESDFVPFFGRDVATFRGPAAFALRSGARMNMGFTVRRPDYSYDFILEEVQTSDLVGATEENVRELTRRHTALLERHIRTHPDHWLWMHRRWKHLAGGPAGGAEGGVGAAS
jgi:KDO2-lipid IV(A) lauroyltransferase